MQALLFDLVLKPADPSHCQDCSGKRANQRQTTDQDQASADIVVQSGRFLLLLQPRRRLQRQHLVHDLQHTVPFRNDAFAQQQIRLGWSARGRRERHIT